MDRLPRKQGKMKPWAGGSRKNRLPHSQALQRPGGIGPDRDAGMDQARTEGKAPCSSRIRQIG